MTRARRKQIMTKANAWAQEKAAREDLIRFMKSMAERLSTEEMPLEFIAEPLISDEEKSQ
jgi:hypothetical protein